MALDAGQALRHPNLVGTKVADRFELVAFAAAGGMGHVYRARDLTSGDIVAVKLLAPVTGVAERFAREAAVLAGLDHPGVVRHLAHGATADGSQYLAMEWLAGEDLAARLGADGTLDVDDAILVARQAADALAATHRAGVVHRDLKPANLFLVGHRFDAVKLLDFGVARTATAATTAQLTLTGVVVGTPAYMAPEQVRGDEVGPAADVYGLGAVLYRCLTGRQPFRGAHDLAVLAKVVVEPASSVSELRPDVPASLDALVARCLSKQPVDRPRDGAALLAELEALQPSGRPSERRIRSSISAREKRIACVVLCAGGGAEDVTLVEERAARTEHSAREAVESHGGSIAAIAKGAWLLTIPTASSAGEQALRAARCALALAALRPETPLFMATGRVLVTGEGRVGEVIDRAAAALVAARHFGDEGGVRVDSATRELLEGRFRFGDGAADDEWRLLLGEEEAKTAERTLLGKPTRCVGREAQLGMLNAALTACAGESHAGAALVIAPIGLGKTHLVRELLRTTRETLGDLEVLLANGDPIRATSPFAMASQILTRAGSLRDSDTPEERAGKLRALVARDFGEDEAPRMCELLGEICGVTTPLASASAGLRAARADLSVMADALRGAWTAWLGAMTRRATVLVLLEDVHWADDASLRLMDAASQELAEHRLFVLATARPEGCAPFADRFRSRGLVELRLPPLSAASAERLVRGALGASLPSDLAETIVRRAGGHPFHLEELVRAVADGHGPDALPDSVLGMVQARLDDLGTEARRMLRAASVFGEAFRASGVAALMGDETSEHEVREVLAQLVAKELLTEERATKRHDAATHTFRHIMMRDAAYAMLTDVDRVQAHRRAAMWLEEVGEQDPAVLGEHYDRGQVRERAVHFFERAAAQALQRNDFERARDHAHRGLALEPDASAEAALRAIEAEMLYWRGDLPTAAERAPSALLRLRRGAPEWFGAVSVAVGALGQLGRNDEVAALLRDAATVETAPESREAHIVALCRGMTQLFWAHAGAGLADVTACLDELVARAEPLDAYQAGWVHRVRGEAAWLHERHVGRCLAELEASCDAFECARAVRPLCLSRLNAASLWGWSGDARRGLELVALARADAERLGAGFLLSYSRAVEGLVLAYAGDPSAAAVMQRARGEVAGSPRLHFIACLVLASLALDRGDTDAADAEARAAGALRVVDHLRAAGLALAARIALARRAPDEALRLALEAHEVAASCKDLELTHGMSGLALAEVHAARGDEAAARDALAPVARSLSEIAATIESVEQRRKFLERPLANDGVARLGMVLTDR